MWTADLRLAARTLRQAPTFTLTAVLSLALGMGASTSVYALAFALFFAPPAGVEQPDSLVRICRLVNGRPEGHEIPYAEYVHYREHASVFAELAIDAWLAGVALFACYVPARRALRVDPVQALRRD